MYCSLPRSATIRPGVPVSGPNLCGSSGQMRHVPGTRATCYSENPPATVTTCRPGFFGSRVCQTRHVPGTRTTCYSDRLGSHCETDVYQYCPPVYQRTYCYEPSYSYAPQSHRSAAGTVFAILALTILVAACV